MATRYWLNTSGESDDTNPADYDQPPQNGDDLVFDPSRPGYNGICRGDSDNGGLNGMMFGSLTVLDGSFVGGNNAFSFAGGTILLNGSCSAATCMGDANVGADGSSCGFFGISYGSGSAFSGSSQNGGTVGDYANYDEASTDYGTDGDNITYNANAQCIAASINDGSGTATFNGASSIYGVAAGTVNWNSTGSVSDASGNNNLSVGVVNAYANLVPSLQSENSSINVAVIKAAGVSVVANGLLNGAGIGSIVVDTTNLTPGNIKSGVTILGETGTLSTGAAGAGYISGGNAGY